MQPLPPTVQLGEITEQELKKPLLQATNTDSSTPSSSPLSRSSPYDVFLSFRGADTRNSFTCHLHASLVHKGINTFIDDEELRKGEEISSALLKAIEGSKISIIIFSENYASSGWCLDELVKILQCMELKQQLVWPVFYKVDPSDVRHQNGLYGEALAKHERRFKDNMDKVKKWRTALRDAASISGWTFSDGDEAKFIGKMAEEISAQVSKRNYLSVAKYPVGMESRVQDMLELLDVGGIDVRMVGIWGIGGIGKTTIAKATFNKIRHEFEGCCFLVDVRAASEPHKGLVELQNVLLREILVGREMKMTDADRGIQVIRDRLGSKRVLIVLDDVNDLNQLDKLAGGLDWFGRGSRIIITTRDKSLLNSHQVYAIYTAEALKKDEARNLLTMNAFKENRKPDEFEKFPIDTALLYAHGLPLAINILGKLLCGKSIKQWHATIDYLGRHGNSDIQKVLEISYSALEDQLKEVFLDIACFLKGKEMDYVLQALEDPNPSHAIEVLEEKALINIDQFGRIWMHDLLEELGKEIVRKESPNDAGKRSRLWFHEDVYRVLTENTGSKKLKGIIVELPGEDEICLSAKCFKKMKNLQLFININARFSGEVNYLPSQLRFLDWPGFPAQSLPSDFNPRKLVNLNVSSSRISQLPQGLKHKFRILKVLSFERCEFLTEVPDLSGGFPNLENLNLSGCAGLVGLHSSVGFLDKLVKLNLFGCTNLEIFPRIVKMKSLQAINLVGCKRLENFPEFEGRMGSLTSIDVSETAIKDVPASIGYHLFNLSILRFNDCENLTNLPLSIYELQELYELEVSDCPNLVLPPFPKKVKYSDVLTLTSNISHYGKAMSSEIESDGDDGDDENDDQGNLAFSSLSSIWANGCHSLNIDSNMVSWCASTLRELSFSESNIVSIPACITKFTKLETLFLVDCKMLQEVPELPPKLKALLVGGCELLERISKLSNISKHEEWQMFERLDFTDCRRLCDSLVEEAEKKGFLVSDDDEVEAAIFSLFLSSPKSAFQVLFPGYEIPKWFSCQMDFAGNQVFEFDVQVLANFEWHNTALALCATGKEDPCGGFKIQINEVLVASRAGHEFGYEATMTNVWLENIPFKKMDMSRFGYRRPRPPFQCRITIYPKYYRSPLESCGVHLIMPQNEECMKLSQARRIESEDYPAELNSRDDKITELGSGDSDSDELESSDDDIAELEPSDDDIAELEPSDSYSEWANTSREEGPSGLKRRRIDL